MIQRIQSIFLLLTAILMAVTIFTPLAVLDMDAVFWAFGICINGTDPNLVTWGVSITSGLASVLALINIFLFKKRKMQMKICHIITLLIVVFYAAFISYLFAGMERLNLSFLRMSYGLALPLVAFIFNILAFLRIKADEKLVQSLNRIR